MTELELIPHKSKMILVVYKDGKVTHRDTFNPASAKVRKAVAIELGLDHAMLFDWCEEAKAAPKRFTVPEPERPTAGAFIVRGKDELREKGTKYDLPASRFVKEGLPLLGRDQLADWDNREALCCLDIDYHDGNAPDPEWLTALVMTRLAPRPLAWHFSKSGGLHLFYVAAGKFTADELAACAALRYRSQDASAGLELKTCVFGPGEAEWHQYDDQDTAAGLVQWLGSPEYDEQARDEWLESEGMECGQRYEHDKCPIDPSPGAEREPVIVSEAGIYCFRCNGKGLTLGSRRPGFASWPSLLGSPSAGELGGLVRNLVHWGQAKWVLTERYALPYPFARLAYRAALKAYHEGGPKEALIDCVFDPRTEELTRVNNLWLSIEASYSYPNNIQAMLACLPAAMRPDGKADPAVVCELNQTKPLDRYGYRNIAVVHGFRLAQQFLPEPESTSVAVLNPDLVKFGSRRAPRYVIRSKRMGEEEAWNVLEAIAPRLDRTYIKTLIASFGCAQETRKGLPPILFASGVSAAGKTAMVQIASGIIGARIGNEAKWTDQEERFREAIRTGALKGPVVVINELLKDAGRSKKYNARQALEFVLTLTPFSASHQLYKGPVEMGRLPSLVITETLCPDSLCEETQLARRIRHHYVTGEKRDWKETIAKAGLSDLNLIRSVSDNVARACDAILSTVVDECFCMPATWDQIADSYGVKTIDESTEFLDPRPYLKELFRLTCAAPKLEGKEAKMYSDGYKRINRGDAIPGAEEDDLAVVYSKFADLGNWASANRLIEKDWAKLLGSDDPVKLDLKGEGNTVYLRFRVGPIRSPTRINEQIVDPSEWRKML